MPLPTVEDLLDAAVRALGGESREGQVAMARAVAHALESREHLLVQAGTGTGKSLAYLVPALLHRDRVVVATATLALQSQLVDRDLPRLVEAVAPLLGRRPAFAILKGRRNYVCRHRLESGAPPDDPDALFAATSTSALGREVLRVRAWAGETDTGDRDELVPGVSERAWSQVAVSARECLGAQRCPFGEECFAEAARDRAAQSDVVVTNHALLAIDALEGIAVLPEHAAVVVDEAHELADRATGVATTELTPAAVERAARRARGPTSASAQESLADAADALADSLVDLPEGRLDVLPPGLATTLALVRDAARAVLSSLSDRGERSPRDEATRRAAADAAEEVYAAAERLAAHSPSDVAWFAREERRGPVLRVAPLSVSGLLRDRLFGRSTVVLTSATLRLGGSFDPVARTVGLPVPSPAADAEGEGALLRWRGLDVGSPFDHRRQAILYVARHLPRPGRDGLPPEYVDELTGLVEAAGGRTLGLFSSMRAASAAAAALRDRLDLPVLCQGEDGTAELVRRFAADPRACLFGTLSLWQGVDVPGPSLQLVVIDRIPFPRPDDPLSSARARAIDAAGGNGFLAVSAATAALRLAQGAGRLLRTREDRGVVAVLDPRLAGGGYAAFLRASLPPFWATTDPVTVRRSLRAIDVAASGDGQPTRSSDGASSQVSVISSAGSGRENR